MKTLIHITGISLFLEVLVFSSCCSEVSRDDYVFSDLLSLDEQDSTEFFELKLPNRVSIRKNENFETMTYFFSDSIHKDFMSLMIGFYSETLALFDLKENGLTKADSFYYFGMRNRGYFVGDTLKKKKTHLYLITPSFDCKKDVKSCHPWPFVFQYDSVKAGEKTCEKIMHSLKYFKKK